MGKLHTNIRKHYTWTFVREIRNAASCLSASRDVICKEVGLSAERWRALAVIKRSVCVLSISDLARALRIRRQSMHRLALGLEKRGWIRFLPNRSDRRLLQMELTNAGISILSTAEQRYQTWLVTMTYDLDDRELCELAASMRTVRERIARARDFA